MAAIESESYFRIPSSVLVTKKMKIYLRTKFRWDISMYDWDETTSGFGNRKAAILEFYFRFRFWPMYSYRSTILHPPPWAIKMLSYCWETALQGAL